MSQTMCRRDSTVGIASAYGMRSFVVKRECISFSQQVMRGEKLSLGVEY